MLPYMPGAVIFDMDGLLIDTEICYRDAMVTAAARIGYSMQTSEYARMCGAPWAMIEDIIRSDHGANFPIEAFRQAWVEDAKILMDAGVSLKCGVVAMLDFLDTIGMPRAIATSSAHSAVQRHLAPFGLPDRFHHILARGDYAEAKPSPAPYLAAAARLGLVPHQCLALEDSFNGVRSASSAGMMTVMIPDVTDVTPEMREKCIFIARDLDEVRNAMQAMVVDRTP